MVSDEADGMLSEILSCSELRSYCKKTGMVLEGGITVVKTNLQEDGRTALLQPSGFGGVMEEFRGCTVSRAQCCSNARGKTKVTIL